MERPSLATGPGRWRALAVFGGIALISFFHVFMPVPGTGRDHMALHGLHSALEGLYYLPLLLAGYWFGRRTGGGTGVLVSIIYGIHTQLQLGGVLEDINRGRLLALALFPIVGLVTGLLADRLRQETRALLDAERQLRRAEMLAALGELSAVLAHEIRNPLTAIRGAADVVAGSVPPDSRDAEFAQLLLVEVGRLDAVLSNFLAFARPGQGTDDVADPALAVKATFTLLGPQATKAGVDLRFHGGGVDLAVHCPAVELRQVLLNLCLNALQAMPDGGTITLGLFDDDDAVVLNVDDTGPGIPAAEREAVLRPFHTTKPGGTGLGLPVVTRIVDGAGGSVVVGDAPAGGARFTLRLPRAPAGRAAPVPEMVG